MKILLVAGALLLTIAALLPFRASASETPAAHPMALAISRPLAGVVTWPMSRPAFHEPGALLLVGSGLMVIGGWLRRATAARNQRPPGA